MWAIQYHRYGGPEVLRLDTVPAPETPEHGVVIRTISSGVSAIDAYYRTGAVRAHGVGFPKRPGFDAFGRVVSSRDPALPEGAWVWTVLGLEPLRTRGTAVELLAVESSRVGRFPNGYLPDAAVGSLALGALTALVGLRDRLGVAAGQRVLVVGAAGAVGLAAVQLAVHLGALVDAVCGPAGLDACRRAGAHEAHDRAAIDPAEFTAAYDRILVAAGSPGAWLPALAPHGRLAATRLDAWLRTVARHPRALGRTRPVAAGNRGADLTQLAGLVAAGALKPVVGRTYAVADLSRAHAELGSGGTAGARLIRH